MRANDSASFLSSDNVTMRAHHAAAPASTPATRTRSNLHNRAFLKTNTPSRRRCPTSFAAAACTRASSTRDSLHRRVEARLQHSSVDPECRGRLSYARVRRVHRREAVSAARQVPAETGRSKSITAENNHCLNCGNTLQPTSAILPDRRLGVLFSIITTPSRAFTPILLAALNLFPPRRHSFPADIAPEPLPSLQHIHLPIVPLALQHQLTSTATYLDSGLRTKAIPL